MKEHCLSLKSKDDVLFKIESKMTAFVMKPSKSMLNLVVDRIYIQQLQYEMERADLQDDLKKLNRVLWSPFLPLPTYLT